MEHVANGGGSFPIFQKFRRYGVLPRAFFHVLSVTAFEIVSQGLFFAVFGCFWAFFSFRKLRQNVPFWALFFIFLRFCYDFRNFQMGCSPTSGDLHLTNEWTAVHSFSQTSLVGTPSRALGILRSPWLLKKCFLRHNSHARYVLSVFISAVNFGTCIVQHVRHRKWSPFLGTKWHCPNVALPPTFHSILHWELILFFAWPLKMPTVHLQPATVSYVSAHYGVHREWTQFIVCNGFFSQYEALSKHASGKRPTCLAKLDS